jgi:hypothetical protein
MHTKYGKTEVNAIGSANLHAAGSRLVEIPEVESRQPTKNGELPYRQFSMASRVSLVAHYGGSRASSMSDNSLSCLQYL